MLSRVLDLRLIGGSVSNEAEAMTPKVHIKIEQIARLRIAGHISDERIARLLGLTRSGLSRILALPEYIECEQASLSGTISKMDEALAGKADIIRKVFAVGVPLAMRALVETVMQRKDLRACMHAATELLDRDPEHTFSKSRVELPNGVSLPEEMVKGIVAEGDAVAGEISTGTAPAPAKEMVN